MFPERTVFPGPAGPSSANSQSENSAGNTAASSTFTPPAVALPKGGGALRGLGEKFSAGSVTGTGSLTVPLAASPGRSGFGPQLMLSYDSGAGNGPFGFGWSLSLPAITRKTDKGLPRYHDAAEADVFLLSGAEDLVPAFKVDAQGELVLSPNGEPQIDEEPRDGHQVRRYRPRVESDFTRIERWTRLDNPDDVHWRSYSGDNLLTIYGKSAGERITDPEDPARIFSWLICETRDDRGNAILYEYKAEDGARLDLAQAHERNRGPQDDPRRTANRYLKRVRYGNRTPLLDASGVRPLFLTPAQIVGAGWLFELVLDYGEHDPAAPAPGDAGVWPARPDRFSAYRAGFEVRTSRLCRRALMFHHFPDEPEVGANCLVRSTDFTYSPDQDPAVADAPIYTFLLAVTQSGYRRQGNGYLKRSLPPLAFTYSHPEIQETVHEVAAGDLANLPAGLDGTTQWVDLYAEGLPGLLGEHGRAWLYHRNLSPLTMPEPGETGETGVQFAPGEWVALRPNLDLAGGALFIDLAGDGQPELVTFGGPAPGRYEQDSEGGWLPFRPFSALPTRPFDDPNLKFIDLDGDGNADLLWHVSRGAEGFGPEQRLPQARDEERGPHLVIADGEQSIYLADFSGDGLTDLARIRNGEVCYWPNLGYGRFGARVSMDNAPWFDSNDQFDPARLRLADIDGSGTTDLIYLHRDGVRLYFNQSGNSWGPARPLAVFPPLDNLASVTVADLLGMGAACLAWSSPLPGEASRPLRYVSLVGERKPHLLVGIDNNLGSETQIHYAPAAKFYLQDRLAGLPWITRLPIPVQVVERVETYDHISRSRFVTRYSYHHGYFDGVEREFRGFGMVEQRDTETFAVLNAATPEDENLDSASHVPPALTRSWFHTGVFLGRDRVSNYFAGLHDPTDRGEYYREPAWLDDDEEARLRLLSDTVLPAGLELDEEREACRALKGKLLRQEVYALDRPGTDDYPYGRPYTVLEQNFTVRRVQSRAGNRYGVFFAHPREGLTYLYERRPEEPRISHTLTLEVNRYGNVQRELVIGYKRLASPLPEAADRSQQETARLTYTENDYTVPVDDPAHPRDYRLPLPADSRTYELTGFTPQNGAARFSFTEWAQGNFARLDNAAEKQYEQAPDPGVEQKRLIEHTRTLYRKDDLTALLPAGGLDPRALPGEVYRLAFTSGLLAQVFQRNGQPLQPSPASVLVGAGADRGGYVDLDSDGRLWLPSGRAFFSPDPSDPPATELAQAAAHFYLLRRYRDPFGQELRLDYDGPANPNLPRYDLLPARRLDAALNELLVENDYRVLQPRRLTDPNRNRTEVAFDALGLVAATAVMGKPGEAVGDSLAGLQPDLTQAQLEGFYDVADPHVPAAALLGSATTRILADLDRFARTRQANPADPSQWLPVYTATLARETHAADPAPPGGLKIQLTFTYSDGFGREIQKKAQAEPGPVTPGGPTVSPRWVGSGWTIYNNKGKPVRQYEPFFCQLPAQGHRFEFGAQVGVSSTLFYDPLERVVAVLHPDHSWEKTVFDAWQQAAYDANDTVLHPDGTTDPKLDPDVGGYFAPLPDDAYLPTWHEERLALPAGDPARVAAEQTAVHRQTPTLTHFDALGRVFLTTAHNRFIRNNAEVEERYTSRDLLDIEGNLRAVRDPAVQNGDAQGRAAARYDYDLLGNRIHQASMEAGERWTLSDAQGNLIYTWDSRGSLQRRSYDALRRITTLHVTENNAERLAERTVYGEGQGDAANHRTEIFQVFDGAGVVTHMAYDFKGNLLQTRRELLPHSAAEVDWAANPAPTAGSFTTRTAYDAINRRQTATSPDGSVYRPTYNEAGLLERVEVNLQGAASATPFITKINYDAKRQRLLVAYAGGAETTYEYEPLTFRLARLRTTRPAQPDPTAAALFTTPTVVQDLRYTYDPSGNITRLADAALPTIFHNNEQVEPARTYTYDAIYRLVTARGREHIGQTAFDFNPPAGARRDHPFMGLRANPNDPQALRNYTETYEYDANGNLTRVRHSATNGSWTRTYEFAEASLLEPAKQSNRLTRSTVGDGQPQPENYAYDAHGSLASLNGLALDYDFEDQFRRVDLGGGEAAFYTYDAAGQRTRKVIVDQNGVSQRERIYVGGFEVYRELTGANAGLVRQTLHVLDDRERIALVETRNNVDDGTPGQRIRFQHGDHLDSAALELDDTARVITYEEYTPFGGTTFQAARAQVEAPKRYRYTGQERDEETGLVYHGRRYYAPWLGRWTQCDPQGIEDGPNLYAYARNNPIVRVDDAGKETKPVVRTDNYRELFRQTLKDVQKRSPTEETIDKQLPKYLKSVESGSALDLATADPVGTAFRQRVDLFGRVTVKLSDFKPPGWKSAGGNPEACYRLACEGANQTVSAGESATGGGGVILYEKTAQRIKTDKTASDLAVEQIRRHIDSGRSVVGGVSEPHDAGVVDKVKQPVTDHFVAIYGYETDSRGKVVALLAKDNASYHASEVRFIVNADGSITKPAEPKRPEAEKYMRAEYQLSEVRFHTSMPYTGDLKPTNDADTVMYWPVQEKHKPKPK